MCITTNGMEFLLFKHLHKNSHTLKNSATMLHVTKSSTFPSSVIRYFPSSYSVLLPLCLKVYGLVMWPKPHLSHIIVTLFNKTGLTFVL